ncbi:MAG: glycosyltransferase family 4 protein [Brasilonema sp.]
MRLLVIFPSTNRGGTEEYALTLASAAAQGKWEVHAAFPQTEGTESLIQDFKTRGIHYHSLNIANGNVCELKKIGKYLPQLALTMALLLKLRPDVVQLNLPYPDHCLGSLLACGLLRIPTAVVFHLIPKQYSLTDKLLRVYAWARKRNQQWIAISENNRKLLCDFFRIPQDQVLRIYNGTKLESDFTSYNPEQARQLRHQVRQELGLSETSQILLTVGRLSSQKGYVDLIPVIAPIVHEFPDVKFIWVGDGEQRETLVKKVKAYGVEDHVLFLGYRCDVPKLLKSADFFVFPTHFEGGQSFALAEAMAYGLPIVTSDASGIPEVIENQVHGLLFPVGNNQKLLEAIRWALKYPDTMQKMAQNAQLRSQEFSEEKMVKETLGAIKDILCQASKEKY